MELIHYDLSHSLFIAVCMMVSLIFGYIIRMSFGEKSWRKRLSFLDSRLKQKLERISALEEKLVIIEDERRELEERGIARKNTLSTLLEASDHAILVTGPKMNIRNFNKPFCEMWDLSEEDISVGINSLSLLECCMNKTIDPTMFYLHINQTLHSKDMIWNAQIYQLNNRILRGSSHPARGVDGTYYGRIWEFTDITEFLQNERKLKEAYSIVEQEKEKQKSTENELYRQHSLLKCTEKILGAQSSLFTTLMESSVHGIFTIDIHMRIRHYNKRFCDMWGLSEKDVVHLGDAWEVIDQCMDQIPEPEEFIVHCNKLLAEHINLRMKQAIDPDAFISHSNALLEQGTVWNEHIHLSNGKIFLSTCSPVIGEDGLYHGRIWEFFDITGHLQNGQSVCEVCIGWLKGKSYIKARCEEIKIA